MKAWLQPFAGQLSVLEYLRHSAREWSRSPIVRQAAVRALRSAHPRPRTPAARAGALLDWTARELAYVPDVRDQETLQSPAVTLRMGGGDCDDLAPLLAAMLRSTGQRVRLVASGLRGLSHVFPEVELAGRWVAADPTLIPSRLGRRAPHRRFVPTAEV